MSLDKTNGDANAASMTGYSTDEEIELLATQMRDRGGFILTTKAGRLIVVDIKWLAHKPAVLLTCDKGGGMIFEFDRPLNSYRLMFHGFPREMSSHASDLINRLFPQPNQTTKLGA
jgi:hypothetical protein